MAENIEKPSSAKKQNILYKAYKRFLRLDYGLSLFWFTFWILFIISCLSSYTYAFYSEFKTIIWMYAPLSGFIAFLFSFPILIFNKLKINSFIKIIYIWIVITIFFILFIIDYFLIFNFYSVVTKDTIDILAETNQNETREFLSVYLSPLKLILGLIFLSLFLVLIWAFSKFIVKIKWFKFIGVAFIVVGSVLWSYSAICFYLYRNGFSIPQYTSLSRVVYSAFLVKKDINHLKVIVNESATIINDASVKTENDSLIVCLVIGESHSYFHTNKYGYSKNTFPKLTKLENDSLMGEIFWFSDIVTFSDHTHSAMHSIFFSDKIMDNNFVIFFPAIFKSLGYFCVLMDNQYLLGKGINFLGHKELSEMVFDERNTKTSTDEKLIDNIIPLDKNELLILHLLGSHYAYDKHYPHEKFSIFKENNYDSFFSMDQRETLAHYDNSLIYTDSNLLKIIEKLKDKKAVLVYISDHGEEIYDQGDYFGHGNAVVRSTPDFQIRIPMFIWVSNPYKKDFPEKVKKIQNSINRPGISDDLAHLLLDLANEKTEFLNDKRSIINDEYQEIDRIVLHSINFDKVKKAPIKKL